LLIRNAELDHGRRIADLRLRDGIVVEIGRGLSSAGDEETIDARGGAVLPGLHDHHIHLRALAASLRSVHCGPPAVANEAAMRDALAAAAVGEDGWIRADAYHESVAGPLDRARLDRYRDDVPLRIQHRSGAMWFLNSPAIERLRIGTDTADAPPGLERDTQGLPTGRLFRGDRWLHERLGSTAAPDLSSAGHLLASFGVTGCTDATATNGESELAAFVKAQRSEALPFDLCVMGGEDLSAVGSPALRTRPGALKVLLDDIALPSIDELAARMTAAHERGRAVAVHCVTRTQLLLALAAWNLAGTVDGDRIEHASVCPQETVEDIGQTGLRIVTQPIFVRDRGDAYLADVDPRDVPSLYRCRSFLEAGIPLAAGSDAPYGDPDPWKAMRAATDRLTAGGTALGESERIDPERALELFTAPLDAPGSTARTIRQGAAADLCILHETWSRARHDLSKGLVHATIRDGAPTFRDTARAS
jgi:predicted amidohydrolase YtcJ